MAPTRGPRARRRGSVRGLVLFPGAGASSGQTGLVAIEQAVAPLGIEVRRCDFPYRLAGRSAPDRPPVLIASVAAAAAGLAAELGVGEAEIALGGRSMGGRMCSMAVAEGQPAAALVLVSYPLHPPGRPDRPRTAHLDQLRLPCLFVSGTRDAFGSPEELATAVDLVPGPAELVLLEGGDHGLRRHEQEAASAVARFLAPRA